MKIPEIQKLIYEYGKGTTLEMLLNGAKNVLPHECPKCKGKGSSSVKYNAYPKGMPDSGWVDDWKYKVVECDLCKGEGYTAKLFVEEVVETRYVSK